MVTYPAELRVPRLEGLDLHLDGLSNGVVARLLDLEHLLGRDAFPVELDVGDAHAAAAAIAGLILSHPPRGRADREPVQSQGSLD